MSETKRKVLKRPEVKGKTPAPQPAQVSDEDRKQNNLNKAISKLTNFNAALKSTGKTLQQVFKDHDIDGDNQITMNEFKRMVNALKINLTPTEFLALFDELDENKSGGVSIQEFLAKVQLESDKADKAVQQKPGAPSSQLPTGLPTADQKKAEEKKAAVTSSLKSMGTSEEEVARQASQFLAKVTVTEADTFQGKRYILNDAVKALKVCEDIVQELKKNPPGEQVWTDPEFGAQVTDVHGYKSICFEYPFSGAPNEDDVFWCRLKDFCPGATPEFLVDGAESNDVCQGSIGDCWMIGAMSVLATDDRFIRGSFKPDLKNLQKDLTDEEAKGMLSGVYPPLFHDYRKYGIYVLRFFKNYAWRYVLVDDRLPCNKAYDVPELIFACCARNNEFWVPLFEKAYAKLHTTYQALISGDISDALVDFTGLVSEKLIIQDKGKFNSKGLKSPESLWERLVKLRRDKALLGCSIVGTGVEHAVVMDGIDTGLLAGHAYSVQSVFTIKDAEGVEQKLVCVRNPWGTKNPKEWTGRWSDDSDEMITNIETINKKLREVEGKEAEVVDLDKKGDGTFYMCFEDFIRIFCKLSVCVKFPVEFMGLRFTSEWAGDSAGGTPYKGTPDQVKCWSQNVQYLFHAKKKATVFVSLGQDDGRLQASSDHVFPFTAATHPMVLVVLKTDGEKKADFNKANIVTMSPIKQFKEISISLELDPGYYCIVPSTMDTGQEGRYYLNIYHNLPGNSCKILNLDTKKEPELIPEEEETTQAIDPELKKILKLKVATSIYC